MRRRKHIDATDSRNTRDGWNAVQDHDSIYLKGKQYRDMREWQRPCGVCGAAFAVFEKTTAEHAGSQFSNRTCDAHRSLTPAFEKGFLAWDGHAIVAGPKCGGGAPTVPGGFARVNAENGKYTVEGGADAARERDEAWARNIELMTEVGAWKRRYEDVFAELQLLKGSMPWSRA